MSETVARHRPSVDLDDFERRMAQPGAHGAPAGDFDDPLAELARLVGEQPDPYRDMFAREAIARPAAQTGASFGPGLDFAAIEAGLRGAIPAHPGNLEEESFEHDQRGDDQGYEPPMYAEPAAGFAQTYPDTRNEWADRAQNPPSRSRTPIYAMVATIAVGVIGIGVAFAFKGTSSSPREIKTIMAAAGPTKIQPPADTAEQTPDSSIGKTQTTPTKLASREEQPVDLSQAVQDNNAREAAARQGADAASVPVPLSPGQARDGIGASSPDYSSLGNGTPNPPPMPAPATADATQGFGAGMPAPKKVKVVSVRPDGSIVSTETPAPAEASARPAPVQAPKIIEKPAKATKTTTRVMPKSVDNLATGDDAAPAPKPAKATKKPKPTRVATADTGEQQTVADAAQPPETSGGGGFAVQLAAPGSESEAKAAASKFGKKFSDALSGRRLGFHKAESNGRTVYRVRVGSLSREDATSLCDKVKADGGSCFVAKN